MVSVCLYMCVCENSSHLDPIAQVNKGIWLYGFVWPSRIECSLCALSNSHSLASSAYFILKTEYECCSKRQSPNSTTMAVPETPTNICVAHANPLITHTYIHILKHNHLKEPVRKGDCILESTRALYRSRFTIHRSTYYIFTNVYVLNVRRPQLTYTTHRITAKHQRQLCQIFVFAHNRTHWESRLVYTYMWQTTKNEEQRALPETAKCVFPRGKVILILSRSHRPFVHSLHSRLWGWLDLLRFASWTQQSAGFIVVEHKRWQTLKKNV